MTRPESAYAVTLQPSPTGGSPVMTWSTVEQGKQVTYTKEPSRSGWQRFEVDALALLPIDHEL